MKRRWPRGLLALLAIVVAGAFVVALFSERRVEGSIPGDDPILSIAVTKVGYLVGTSKGAFSSPDATSWKPVKRFGRERTLLATRDEDVVTHSGRVLAVTKDLKEYDPGFAGLLSAIAIAADPVGNIYLAEDPRHISLVTKDGGLQRVRTGRGPKEIIAIAGIPGDPVTLLAGGLTSGLWRSVDGGLKWTQILRTPTRALLVDSEDTKRIFLGTAGGVLVSRDGGLRWRLTEMNLSVEALSQFQGEIFAVTQERLVYSSATGTKNWNPLAVSKTGTT